jgi:hypothetical protein
VLKPRPLSPSKLDAGRPNAQESTRRRTAPGKAHCRKNGLRNGDRSRIDQYLMPGPMDAPPDAVGRVARATLAPGETAHPWFAEFVRVLRRPGMGVISALRRFQGEEGFKKIVFLYERSRHLYENKEGDVQNEAKTNLKMSWFLTKRTEKDPRVAWFLIKRTQSEPKRGSSRAPSADVR